MKASALFAALSVSVPERDICAVTQNSAQADSGSVFVCIKGWKADGHLYAADAYRRGCRLFVAQEPLSLPSDATVVVIENSRLALATLACTFYDHPSRKLKVVGITGTKGKTTCALLLTSVLRANGIRCGYIGTNGIDDGTTRFPTVNTTPDALTLQSHLSRMAAAGVTAVVMEISSQALAQYRADGIAFCAVLYTNLFADHIGVGEHADFVQYRNAKRRLFTEFGADTLLYNQDDAHAAAMLDGSTAKRKISCSTTDARADYFAGHISHESRTQQLGLSFTLQARKKQTEVHLPLFGAFNAENALLAIAAAREVFGIELSRIATALQHAETGGRAQCIPLSCGAIAVIDYAHNGGALRNLLQALREYHPKRILCLFGSVGERTQLRRAELGAAAAELADLCILTSDNPGCEPPQQILDEIALSFVGSDTPYECIPDRKAAIERAVSLARAGDILVLAGKGHETYQLIGTEKQPFSEKEILLGADRMLHV